MAKKDNDNFDFETESEGKSKFDIAGFFKNLTKQQKGIILIAAVALVLIIAIVVTLVIIGANGGFGNNDNNTDQGTNNQSGVSPEDIESIYVSAQPNKQVYYVGEQPNYSGLIICINSFSAGTTFESYDSNPDAFTFSGFDSSVPNDELKITVEFKGKVLSFNLKIIEIPEVPPVLQSIYLEGSPKTEYKVGGTFFALGAKIIAVYSDGTTKEISLKKSNLSGFNEAIQTPGEHEIKVGYFDDNGGYAETTFTINVTE